MKKMLLTLAAMLIAVGAMAQAQVEDSADQVVTYNLVQPFISIVANATVHYHGHDYDASTGNHFVTAGTGWEVTSNRHWSSSGTITGQVGGEGVFNGWWVPTPDYDGDGYPENRPYFGTEVYSPTTPGVERLDIFVIGEWGSDVADGEKTATIIMNVWHVAAP